LHQNKKPLVQLADAIGREVFLWVNGEQVTVAGTTGQSRRPL